jgi:nucleotide-binding universal stress UspA family protein
MVSRRQINEEGHKRKFLAVIDGTPECGKAVLYAGRRAKKTHGGLVLLYVCEPGDFQHWIGVEEIMKAEAREEAASALDKYSRYAREKANIEPELVIREGATGHEILALIEEDKDIAQLVLAASDSKDGPGPLVSSVAGRGHAFPIPVVVLPAAMSDEDVEAAT